MKDLLMIKIGVIISSTRDSRASGDIGNWAFAQLPQREGIEYELIDLKSENLPFLNEPKLPSQGDYQLDSTKQWSAKIDALDGFILVMPEYNHGYPAPLKNALDTLYREWKNKPVSFIGHGVLGAARSIDQIVPVVAQIGMVPLVSTAINIIESYAAVDTDKSVKASHIKGASFDALVNKLEWWAKLLKTARAAE